MTFEDVPQNVWLGIAASSLLFILVGDSIRWLLARRKAQAANKAEEAEKQELRQLLRDLRSEDVTLKSIRSTVNDLPQEPLGDGRTFTELPEGTNIVSMSDGSYRLAVPIDAPPLTFGGTIRGSLSLSPEVVKKGPPATDDDEAKDGGGA